MKIFDYSQYRKLRQVLNRLIPGKTYVLTRDAHARWYHHRLASGHLEPPHRFYLKIVKLVDDEGFKIGSVSYSMDFIPSDYNFFGGFHKFFNFIVDINSLEVIDENQIL